MKTKELNKTGAELKFEKMLDGFIENRNLEYKLMLKMTNMNDKQFREEFIKSSLADLEKFKEMKKQK